MPVPWYGVGNAVVLASGASLTNLASGTIAGADSAIYSPTGGSANTVVNAGSLGATAFVGVRLREGGALTNAASGTISGAYAAVYVAGGIGTVTNAGLITAASGYYYSDGVGLFAGGMVSNAASGTITAALKGVAVYGAVGTVANLGTIIGSGFIGVALDAGGAISNAAGGMIGGGYVGIYTGGSASTITNDGSVAAGAGYAISTGIAMYAGGSVTNSAAGGISGVAKGIAIYNAAGTITNLGSIGATGAAGTAVSLAAGFANLLVDEPDAVFTGTVDGGNTIGSSIVSTLEFGSSSLHGTITGLGTQFIDFAQVTVDPGASWTVSGSNSLAAGITLTDRGTLLLNGGTLADAGPATISGTVGEFADATVAGAGAVWSGSAGLVVGDLGSGALVIGSQGSVTAAAQGSSVAAVLGAGIGSDGALQVVGPGAAFSAAGQLDVGQAGAGHLRVQNQGTVQTGGNAAVDALQGFDIAQAAGGLGDAVVAGSLSLLSNTGRFVVGDAGFGSLAIEAGGTVITTPGTVAGLAGAVIGAQAGADGSAVNVAGAGSNWRITGTLQVGDAAAGSLAIAGGGTVSAGALDAGAASGGSGNVSVVGSGSGLALGSQLTVGDAGSAELSILSGGMVSADNADIGVQAGATGNVDIEGVGSHLDIANDLTIGVAGVGVLTLGAGTELTVVNNLVVGANGVLNQFGGVIDPSTITIVAGGRQGGHGTTTASVEISNAGTLFASSGIETVNTPLITAPSGKSGVLEIDAGGDLVLNAASVDATQSVTFTDGTGILDHRHDRRVRRDDRQRDGGRRDHRAGHVDRVGQLRSRDACADAVRCGQCDDWRAATGRVGEWRDAAGERHRRDRRGAVLRGGDADQHRAGRGCRRGSAHRGSRAGGGATPSPRPCPAERGRVGEGAGPARHLDRPSHSGLRAPSATTEGVAGPHRGRRFRPQSPDPQPVPLTGPRALHRRCPDPGEAPHQRHHDCPDAGRYSHLLPRRTAGARCPAGGQPPGGILSRRRRPRELRQRSRPHCALSGLCLARVGCRRLRAPGGHRRQARRDPPMGRCHRRHQGSQPMARFG